MAVKRAKFWENKRIPPKAKVKKKGKYVETSPFETAAAQVAEFALRKLLRTVSQEIRNQYTGQIDLTPERRLVTVTLTHTATREVIEARATLPNLSNDALIAKGAKLWYTLDAQIVAHQRGYDLSPYARTRRTEVTKKKPKPKKRKPKLPTCVLCGDTPSLYPEWGMECNHTEQERKGNV